MEDFTGTKTEGLIEARVYRYILSSKVYIWDLGTITK